VLPCASVAEQLTVVGPNGNVAPDAGLQVGAIAPSTLSFADAKYVTTAPAELVASRVCEPLGTLRNGGLVSCTTTVKLPVFVLPCASVAEQLTVVGPNGNVEP